MHSLMEAHPDTSMRVLYIEGFSPGPGLPSPLLTRAGCFKVISARMPYGISDHCCNPFGLAIILAGTASIWFSSEVTGEDYGPSSGAWWRALLVLCSGFGACYILKLLAVGWCIDRCVNAYAAKIASHNPDIIIGYSWGGGIACGLLNRGLWKGATLLIAPAGEQMWAHAGRRPPSLRADCMPVDAAVMTLHGDADGIVPLAESRRLHAGANDAAHQLVVAPGEGHFLENTVTHVALGEWAHSLCARAGASRRKAGR